MNIFRMDAYGGANILFYKFNDTHVRFVAFQIQWATDFPQFFIRSMYACEKPELKFLLSTGRIFNIVLSYSWIPKLQK